MKVVVELEQVGIKRIKAELNRIIKGHDKY